MRNQTVYIPYNQTVYIPYNQTVYIPYNRLWSLILCR